MSEANVAEEEKLAYETHEYRGHRVKGFYLGEGNREGRIEVWKGEEKVQEGTCWAYKIWNYSAHATGIIDDILGSPEECEAASE